jgi:formylglycine-generating enzyme required for sulfatase activity
MRATVALPLAVLMATLAASLSACDRSRPSSADPGIEPAGELRPDQEVDPHEPRVPAPPPIIRKSSRGDCSTDYAPRPARDPNPMCKIDGGAFWMGPPEPSSEGDGYERPESVRVTLSGFYMDQLEVTVAQYLHYLNAVGSHDHCPTAIGRQCVRIRPAAQYGILERRGDAYAADPGTEHLPIDHVSREGAARYCAWVGKRLPTEAEWEYAARNDPASGRDLRYPWGDEFEPRRANCRNEDCGDDFPDLHLAPVGTYDGTSGYGDGASPWGVLDMLGNVAEWVVDCHYSTYHWCEGGCTDPVAPVPPRGPCQGILRGGDVMSAGEHLSTRWRNGIAPYASRFQGFRCVRALH